MTGACDFLVSDVGPNLLYSFDGGPLGGLGDSPGMDSSNTSGPGGKK